MTIEQTILHHVAASGVFFECCGLVVETPSGQEYVPCRNIHPQPDSYFDIHSDDWIDAENKGPVVAVVHSHPGGPAVLSAADRASQLKTGLEWWLVAEGEIYRFPCAPPLLKRDFEHGKMDCYSLFRDAYALAGYPLPDFEREDGWWKGERELYLENMASVGFFRVDDPQPGDVMLIQLVSDRANHAAIYLGNMEILHHVPESLSRRCVFGGYWQRHLHSIWRYEKWQKSAFTGICNDLAVVSP